MMKKGDGSGFRFGSQRRSKYDDVESKHTILEDDWPNLGTNNVVAPVKIAAPRILRICKVYACMQKWIPACMTLQIRIQRVSPD